jgi:dTMP kinase
MRGWFITFEGIDGSGKSSHLRKAALYLSDRGADPIVTREPGGTPIGVQIRSLLLSNESREISPEAETILYASDRAEHVRKVIGPRLAAARIVLCDRYVDSTLAFQGYGRGLDLSFVEELNRIATGGLRPDLTILLDVDPVIARSRLDARAAPGSNKQPADRFDDEAHDFHSRVRAGYLALAAAEPGRIRLVDTSVSADEAHAKVVRVIREHLGIE